MNASAAAAGFSAGETLTIDCLHCGTPFEPEVPEQKYCCAGCSFVHDLIAASGLNRFYELKGGERILPAGSAVLVKPDAAWAEEAQAQAETAAGTGLAELKLDLQGVSCIGCVWLIDALFQQRSGAARIFTDPTRGEATLSWIPGKFQLAGFVQQIGQFGYRLAPASSRERPSGASGLRLGLCGALMLNAMAFTLPRYLGMEKSFPLAGIFELIAAFSATLSLLAGGSYFIHRAWSALRAGRLHLDVPIAGGILTAWGGSLVGWLTNTSSLLYFDFVATFIFLMLLGRRLQEVSVSRNRSRILRADPLLQNLRVLQDGTWTRQPVEQLGPGAEFAVPSGGVVPVTAELQEDTASLSLEWINGEAEPRTWRRGSHVPAGAVNLAAQEVRFRAREGWKDSLLQRLSAPASVRDNPAARWLDRVLRIYLLVVLTVAMLGGAGWLVFAGEWTLSLQVTISVLVVSCPCALGVAVPMAHELAVARLRQQGLFVRRPDIWGRLQRVRSLVFDKTGTLTLDAPGLKNPDALAMLGNGERQMLSQMALESRHPVSAALREALAANKWLGNHGALPVVETPGLGLACTDAAGRRWELRRPDAAEAGEAIFACNGRTLAAFEFEEQIRPDARRELDAFKARGFAIHLLSGDRPEKVRRMAEWLGIPPDQALARQSPEQKADWISRTAPADALFIGDGANDSLAADASLVRGTPAVERCLLAEKSDFYFLSRGLRPLRALFDTASLRRTAVRRAFTFALIYNISAIVLCLGGKMNPLLAAILMPLSSVVTVLLVTQKLRDHRQRTAR